MLAVWPPVLRMTTSAVLPAPGMGVTDWMMSLAWVLPLHSAGAGGCAEQSRRQDYFSNTLGCRQG
jgi:hypothetical protein